MSTPAPQVVPLFATPFGVVSLPEAQALNPALAALFAERATAQWHDPLAADGALIFRSRADLLEWPEEPVRQAIRAMLAGVGSVAASINDLGVEQFAALRVQARAWFTLVRPDGCVPPASYPNTSWLAVYCVTAPAAAQARFDSGVLRMHESRPGPMFQDAAHSGIRVPYRPGHYAWRPVPGQMAVFPAAITHEIALVRAAGALVIVTARVRFVASDHQAWMPPVVSTALTLSPIFAVPLGEARLVPCERLNRELEALFLARETDEHRNPMPSHIPQEEVFESRFNLFRWPEPCVQELRKFMLDSVAQTVLQASTLSAEDLARLKFHNHTWFHVTRHGGSFVCHNHPMASWSAVYCVRAGEAPAGQPGSGVLRFFDPRGGANAYLDPANARLQPPFALKPLEFRLTEGQIVVCPSYLFHEVTPFYGRDLRITVATNCWFA